MSGLLALDIDGTITTESKSIPDEVVRYLISLESEGWTLALVTGRTYNQCHDILQSLPFTYYLAVQNGAILLSMPEKAVISRHYIDKDTLLVMSEISQDHPSDVVVYSGFEHGDRCFYRPDAFESPLKDYLARRCEGYQELWEPLESFHMLPIDGIASTKSFGTYKPLEPISAIFEQQLKLHAPINRDPFQDGYYVMQATHGKVNKGVAVRDLRKHALLDGVVIAAGDDLNDIELLLAADIRVAMADAPSELLSLAHIVAPRAKERGIIEGLDRAIKRVK